MRSVAGRFDRSRHAVSARRVARAPRILALDWMLARSGAVAIISRRRWRCAFGARTDYRGVGPGALRRIGRGPGTPSEARAWHTRVRCTVLTSSLATFHCCLLSRCGVWPLLQTAFGPTRLVFVMRLATWPARPDRGRAAAHSTRMMTRVPPIYSVRGRVRAWGMTFVRAMTVIVGHICRRPVARSRS